MGSDFNENGKIKYDLTILYTYTCKVNVPN